MRLTQLFTDRILFLSDRKPTDSDKHQVCRCLMDYAGVSLAGSVLAGKKIDQYLNSLNSKGEVRSIGVTEGLSPESAAFVNGFFSHAAELDDGDRYGMFHPGAPLFSALLVLMQLKKITSDQFCRAVISGYEASVLMARSMQPALKENGFHGTGIAGIAGAAVACSVALGAGREELESSLSAACTKASGMLKVINSKSEYKPLNVANASQGGLQSALIAHAGFKGNNDILDGETGFFRIFTESPDSSVIEQASNSEKPMIYYIYVKPYAACRHCHAPIEAALNMAAEPGFSAGNVASVEISTYKWAIKGHDHSDIVGMNSARMSIPYSVAAALSLRNGGVEAFDEPYISDKTLLELCKKIRVLEDSLMTQKVPDERGARVKVILKSSKNNEKSTEAGELPVSSHFVSLPKGEPENPVSDEELIQKMKNLFRFSGLSFEKIQAIEDFFKRGRFNSEEIAQMIRLLN